MDSPILKEGISRAGRFGHAAKGAPEAAGKAE